MINVKEAIKAQKNLCAEKHLPNFAGDGYCSFCGKNVFSEISVEVAGRMLVTGCPHCNRSFCD